MRSIMLEARMDMSRRGVRRPLLWVLGVVGVATAVSLRWSDGRSDAGRVVEAAAASERASGQIISSAQDIPSRLPTPDFGSEGREPFDPFAGITPPPTVAASAAAPPAPAPPAPIPPTAYRLFGIVTEPDGSSHVYLTKGEGALAIEKGLQLDDGYQVESWTDEAVTLRFAGSETRILIPLQDARMVR
jgi:hypothetical protein